MNNRQTRLNKILQNNSPFFLIHVNIVPCNFFILVDFQCGFRKNIVEIRINIKKLFLSFWNLIVKYMWRLSIEGMRARGWKFRIKTYTCHLQAPCRLRYTIGTTSGDLRLWLVFNHNQLYLKCPSPYKVFKFLFWRKTNPTASIFNWLKLYSQSLYNGKFWDSIYINSTCTLTSNCKILSYR